MFSAIHAVDVRARLIPVGCLNEGRRDGRTTVIKKGLRARAYVFPFVRVMRVRE